MTEKVKILLLALMLAAGLMLTSFFAGWSLRGSHEMKHEVDPVPDTTWFTLTEEIPVPSPPDTVYKTEYKTVKVPLHDTIALVDSVWVTLPFERHFSRLDSVADVWYSGYEAKIDSARVYKHTVVQVVTQNQVEYIYKMPRLTLDIGAGAMWHENTVKPYAIGKLTLNRPHTTFAAFGAINQHGEWGAGLNVTYRLNIVR